jgi:hypothetical protein
MRWWISFRRAMAENQAFAHRRPEMVPRQGMDFDAMPGQRLDRVLEIGK